MVKSPYPFYKSNSPLLEDSADPRLEVFKDKEFYCGDQNKKGYHECCFNHILQCPIKLGQEHPIYDYEVNLIKQIDKSRNIWIKKASGIGATEIILRYLLWKILSSNELEYKNIFILSGTHVIHAHDVKVRMEEMFRRSFPDIQFNSKYTELKIKNTTIRIFPSRNVKDLRGYTNVSYLFIDEADFFDLSINTELLHAITRYEEKSHCTTIMCSTPNRPDGLFQSIELDPNSKYKKILLPYQLGLDKIYNRAEIEAKKKEPEFEREYNLKYTGLQGNTFSITDIEASIKRHTDLQLSQIPHTQGGAYFIGVDIASGSSNTAITVTQRLRDPNVVRILFSQEYVKPSTSQIIDILHRLRLKYGISYTYIFTDASAAMFNRELCISVGQDPNYDLKTVSPDSSYVIPVVWSVEGRKMLSNLEYIINKGYMAIDPQHDKIVTSLKTCYSVDWKMDKERTSYNDTLDSLLLSCRGYQISEKLQL